MNSKLRRDGSAMELYGALVDAEVIGNLLVEPSLHDVLEHLKFAPRERGESRTQLGQPCTLGALTSIASERAFHSFD
jgi:hypothetical protein